MSDHKEKYRFDISNSIITAVYELEDGVWEWESIDSDETYTLSGSNIVKTEFDDGTLKQVTFTDSDGNGIYAKSDEGDSDRPENDLDHTEGDQDQFEDDLDHTEDDQDQLEDDLDHAEYDLDQSDDDLEDDLEDDTDDDLEDDTDDDLEDDTDGDLDDGTDDDLGDGLDDDLDNTAEDQDHSQNDDLGSNQATPEFSFHAVSGDEIIDGRAGFTQVEYDQKMFNYTVSVAVDVYVDDNQGNGGHDQLIDVERIEFSDVNLAFDLEASQSGGKTALMLGAAFGKEALENKQLTGIGIHLFDSGLSSEEVAQLAINTGLISDTSENGAFVTAVWENIFNIEIDQNNLDLFTGLLENGSHTQASLLAVASNTLAAEQLVDLIGLTETGFEFVDIA